MEEKRASKSPAATDGGRSPRGVAAGAARDSGRWSSRKKAEVVLRMLRGEDIDALSRELKVTAARLTEWRERFLAGGQSNLKSREADGRDEENSRLKKKVGELTMDNELLYEKIERMEDGVPPRSRRSRR